MYSIAYPDMFSHSKTNLVQDREASMQNMRLLLASVKKSLLGDPYFGTNLKTFLYDQNNSILADLLIDDIYAALIIFMPQIIVTRNDITITRQKNQVFIAINCINRLDNTTNMYKINLTEDVT